MKPNQQKTSAWNISQQTYKLAPSSPYYAQGSSHIRKGDKSVSKPRSQSKSPLCIKNVRETQFQ